MMRRGVARAVVVRVAGGFDLALTLVLAVVVELGLRLMGLPRLLRLLGLRMSTDGTAARAGHPVLPVWAKRRMRNVDRCMRRWPAGDTCLRRALLSGQRLHALGPVLRLGVRVQDTEVHAHAWLEIYGQSMDPHTEGFAPLRSIGPAE
jgi:Transglutaminase-like superfamily